MPHYLLQGTFSAQAISGLVKNPEDRSVAIRSIVEGLGGRLECMYYTFGESDVFVIVELPDNVTMAAMSMGSHTGGLMTNIKTTVLIPISEGVEAARIAGSIDYQPPGS